MHPSLLLLVILILPSGNLRPQRQNIELSRRSPLKDKKRRGDDPAPFV
jgi:hypothetical protein